MSSSYMGNSASSPAKVKQEAAESGMIFGPSGSVDATSRQDRAPTRVKAELNEIVNRFIDPAGFANSLRGEVKPEERQPSVQGPQAIPPHAYVQNTTQYAIPGPPLFKEYRTADEIGYTPEDALSEGTKMVQTLKSRIKLMNLGSKLRQEVWARDITNLESQGSPTTLIAVCGATGAGKSSILNAILDDNIVPTSGMRACTAVVTEIAYHKKPTIEADVAFLSLAEWKSELAFLLQDMVDEDGKLKRSTDMRTDAGIAWSKVHAVYPSIVQEDLLSLSVDQIIAFDRHVTDVLGTTKRISARDSRTFAKEIAKYIDSKDQKRAKKDKEKARKGRSEPALWPLIRQVRVRCKTAALSTGAVLVDLPGVADANAARNNVAQDYMKKANYIWILAPITRAVDDKTARDLLGDAFKVQLMMDGNYDDHAITFIATKCDDISCSEVIHALALQDSPVLEPIENRIDEIKRKASTWRKKESTAQKQVKTIKKELETLRKAIKGYEKDLEQLKNGETIVQRSASRKTKPSKKRKHQDRKPSRSSKKRRTMWTSEDEDDMSDTPEIDSSLSESHSSNSESEDSDASISEQEDELSTESESEQEDGLETEDSLKAKITDGKTAIKALRVKLTDAREMQKEASDKLATLKKSLTKVQREKNAFCSLERSKFSRDVLKEDFRTGLKHLDDATAEERDPDNFDPSTNLRDYDEIDLPVFTCSSRDYVRIKGQVKGDGEPSCFENIADTGIPELQKWCHELTIASRERSARNFLTRLKAFATGVESYIQGMSKITPADREALRKRWESTTGKVDTEGDYGESRPIRGVAPELIQECLLFWGSAFVGLVDKCVEELQTHFKDGLEEKCRVGAANASSVAVQTSDEFANTAHWATYRATLRRHGTWRHDLNAELALPFTRNIASSWCKVFESDLFTPFEAAVVATISNLLKEVEGTAASGLQDRFQYQGDLCLEEARIALQQIMGIVQEALSIEQKEVSRSMAPHIQSQLSDGYERAMEERGRGSVARQKAVFRQYVTDSKDDMFEDGAEVIMDRLASVAKAVGEKLGGALTKLAEKMEVNISVLWEGAPDGSGQIRARQEVLDSVLTVLKQLELWTQAAEQFKRPKSQPMEETPERENTDEDIEMSQSI